MASNLKPAQSDKGTISKQFLKKLTRTDFKTYYSTPYLNDILYLHYKGFQKIANLQEYTGLKVIYLEGNSIQQISGLETLVNLRCLYLQQNLIKKIQGLDSNIELSNLNLSDNMIEVIQGLDKLTKLQNLQIKNNRIGLDGIRDVIGLLECPNISCLDISNNKIQGEDFVTECLMKMPNIAVVYLQNNEFNKKISHYRKTLITKIPSLKYLDDKPVFEDEKRFSQAWARGGLTEQRKERELYRIQKEQEQIRQHQQFKEMMERNRAQVRARRAQNQVDTDSQNESNSKEESIQSYVTPEVNSQKTPENRSQQNISNKQHQSEKQQSEKQQNEKISEKNSEKGPEKGVYLDQLD